VRTRSKSHLRTLGASLLALAFVATTAGVVDAKREPAGYLTDDDPFITLDPGLPAGASVKAIISSGESLGDFTFQGLPDGIGVRPGEAKHTVDVYVVHEETTVPFFGTADFQDASASKLTLSTKGGHGQGGILDASVAIDQKDGFLRFCSASMAGPAEGFADHVFLTGEETNDAGLVPPTVDPLYGADAFPGDGTRQGGFAVALNTETGDYVAVPGMGRLNHENTIALPGYDQITLLTTDDTFDRPSAQVYMYLADDQAGVFADEGRLWAFRVTAKNGVSVDPTNPHNGANDYGDVQPGDDLAGEFILVPENIAKGTTSDLPQDALENWSNDHNVFQFVRAEDIGYDKNDPTVVYMADTGGGQIQPNAGTGRLFRDRSQSESISPNGSIFRFDFNDEDPKVVDSFSVLAQGDDSSKGAYVAFKSPDNLDTSKKSLMVQEDTDDAKVWQYRLRQDTWRTVATVNDPDGESSGIVDVSEWFGGGTWLLDVQGHGVNVEESFDPGTGVTSKLESGQLMLMKIPGS
jgi:hypothetical protein